MPHSVDPGTLGVFLLSLLAIYKTALLLGLMLGVSTIILAVLVMNLTSVLCSAYQFNTAN